MLPGLTSLVQSVDNDDDLDDIFEEDEHPHAQQHIRITEPPWEVLVITT